MNSRILEGIKVILREKSGKKLALRSVIAFLLVTVIVFFAVFSLFETMRVEQMSEYLEEIPGIIENRENELLTCSHIYEGDILARAELGLILSREENVSDTEAEMLERVRAAVSADSVSLVDGQGELIATTGTCKTGADHQHPSFNRRGDMILFSNPDENGVAQVCTIDLKQVKEDW